VDELPVPTGDRFAALVRLGEGEVLAPKDKLAEGVPLGLAPTDKLAEGVEVVLMVGVGVTVLVGETLGETEGLGEGEGKQNPGVQK